jgi:hypothetical protein
MAAFTNSLGDMEVVDWREFRRMEESNSSLFLVRNFDIRKRSFSLFIPSPYLSSMRTRDEGAKMSG